MIETGRAEYERTVGAFPRFDVELAGVVPTLEATPTNAVAWLYYLTVLLPALTLLVVTLDVYRRRHGVRVLARPAMANEAQKMTAAAVLAVLMHMFLLRAASESAIADVSTATAVLGAWLLARGLIPAAGLVRGAWRASANASRPAARRVAVALIQAVVAVAIAGLTLRYLTQTEGGDAVRTFAAELRDDGEEGAPAFRRLDEFRRMSPPFEDEGARYVFACTSEADRLLVVSEYAPHAPYAAGRGFAAGRLYFLSSFAPSAEYHAFSLERLREERVPIVLVNRPDREGFARGFSALHQYLLEHYREAGETEFDETPLTVLVDARIAPVGTYGPRALPCFRAAAEAAESHDAAD
jgi:hypothetical protein